MRNAAQRAYWSQLWYRNIILKARQLGFSTLIAIDELDNCLFNSNTAAGLIDRNIDDAAKKLGKIKFAYNSLPDPLKAAIPLVKQNTKEIEFANGSSIRAGTSHRGSALQILHVSEFGPIAAERPEKAREIRSGALSAVHAGQMIHVESTAKGTAGEFYEMVQRADVLQKEKRTLSLLDFKLHFFPWWKHGGYRLSDYHGNVGAELKEYFEELQGKYGIALDDAQKAWYAAKLQEIGPDDIKQEFPAHPDEAFFASIEGAYFKREMTKARLDNRIGQVPHVEGTKVNTFWDLGRGTTAITFHQTDGVRHRLIGYYEDGGESMPFYVRKLQEIKEKRGFVYGKHFGPHDIEVADWGGDGKTRLARAESLGLNFEVVPRVDDKDDAIEEARHFLALCWIDAEHCERLIACLDNYRKQWDERRATWKSEPFGDWASHGADSVMTGAMGFTHDKPQKRRGQDRPERSAWGV